MQRAGPARPLLVVFAGLPGSGKTTLARGVALRLGAVHIRIDTIEQTIRDTGLAQGDIGPAGYQLGYAVARDNLSLGLAVVAAASLRARASIAPPLEVDAPPAQIETDPQQVAMDHLARAFHTLKGDDRSACDPQLFRQLRLMMNRLENGGLRARGVSEHLAPTSISHHPVEPVEAPVRRRDAWLSQLRTRSGALGRALLG